MIKVQTSCIVGSKKLHRTSGAQSRKGFKAHSK